MCTCADGWELDPQTGACDNIDECAAGTDDCDDSLGTCQDSAGSYDCGCVEGYELAGDGTHACVDIDECATDADDCAAPNYACLNTVGAFECVCAPGWADLDCATCVRYAGPAGGDGLTWANASASLDDAVTSAEAAVAGGAATCEVWVQQGTWSLFDDTGGSSPGANVSGAVSLYGGFSGAEAARSERSDDPSLTVLDASDGAGGGLNQVLRLNNGASIDGFTVTGATGTATGGGIQITAGTATVTNCIITGNKATKGGGISVDGGAILYLTDSVVDHNEATDGGGVNQGGGARLYLIDSVVLANSAEGKGGGLKANGAGGGLLRGARFEGNSAATGGAGDIRWSALPFYFEDSTFVGNAASGAAGAVYITNDNNQNGNVNDDPDDDEHSFTSCVFVGNSGTEGGALMLWATPLAPPITNCTFAYNAANEGGAIAYHYTKDTTLTNSIVYGNNAPTQANLRLADGPTLTVSHTLVAGGFAGDGNIDASPEFVHMPLFAERVPVAANGASMTVIDEGRYSIGDVLEFPHTSEVAHVVSTELGQVSFDIDVDPGPIGPMAVWNWGPVYDGAEWDVRLMPGSPAIDAGDDSKAPPLDIVGNPRVDQPPEEPPDSPKVSDLGAYEFVSVPD